MKIFLKTTTRDERDHVAFLKKALGSKAVKSPKFDFKGIPTNEKMFAATAQVLENTGVHAYLGQAGNFKNPAYLGRSCVDPDGRSSPRRRDRPDPELRWRHLAERLVRHSPHRRSRAEGRRGHRLHRRS